MEIIVANTKDELINEINKIRRKYKNTWYYIETMFDEHKIYIKGHGTWVQRAEIYNNLGNIVFSDSSCMDGNVTYYKNYLNRLINKIYTTW